VFDWDKHNLKKVRVHRITVIEVEQVLTRDPILIYEQEAQARLVTSTTAKPNGAACSPSF